MGIKGLWAVFAPYCEKKSLHEIQGETVAVDLSGWICDSQNVTDYYIQPKLYLRNLFFRTVYLILADIKPIFVLEGDAPELKRDVMAARNAVQFRGAPSQSSKTSDKPDVARRRFRGVLKECESLLKSMGVKCIKGSGEAEATCAQLNAQGVVHAVVSQDSDCFAYGARCVYRNFSVSNSAGGGAMQGSVDCYDADVMLKSNGFGRNKMIALALLCGCDYGVGACGSSINTVVSFLHTVPDDQIIRRLISWVSDTKEYEERGRWASLPGRCDRCGHAGRSHAKNGCPVCATGRGCDDKGHKAKVAEVKRELSLRTRALSCGMPFPEPKVMKEFLNASNDYKDLNDLTTPVPSLIQFVKLMCSKLDWSERYCVEKFLPILTKWHLQDTVICRKIKPKEIKKKRNPKGVPSYEVVWDDINGEFEGLIPDDQFEDDEDPTKVWTSIERQDLMRKYYPDLVETYEESIKKPVKVKKTRQKKDKENQDPDKPKRKYNRKKKVDELEVVNNSLKRLSLDATDGNTNKAQLSISVAKLKRKIKNNSKTKHIDSYFKSKKRKCSTSKIQLNNQKDDNKENNESQNHVNNHPLKISRQIETEVMKNNVSFFNSSTEEVDISNLSDIVDRIVTRGSDIKTASVNNNFVKLIFEKNKVTTKKSIVQRNFIQNNCSTPKSSPVRKKTSFDGSNRQTKVNTSYFFDKLTDGCDAFEMSLEYKSNDVKYDCNSTVDCSLPDVIL
ncbi:flap endonuclease GEN [Papilio machaon]|uniref:flap endonuclease GEN n=1 Tax=Papilio machaon TaxID=76193 RepID=UPI001E662D9A|nr:flap endonuclease GEN [Papilio machaon]